MVIPLSAQQQSERLIDNWQFLREDLGGIWEFVRDMQPGFSVNNIPRWEPVKLPHCYNAYDAVDPDKNYYEGPAWYRTLLDINNSFSAGRTLLHFEGAGQKTAVYIYMTKVGEHVGGYDEWTVDITDAVDQFLKSEASKEFKGKIPLSIRCDNSRDLEMIPSDLADFNIYGGIYRYLDLVYVPALSLAQVHIEPRVDENGKKGAVEMTARFYNPGHITGATVSWKITGPAGHDIMNGNKAVNVGEDVLNVGEFMIKKPDLWSPDNPNLYTCQMTVHSEAGDHMITQKFGFRNFEFLDHGPFMLNGKRLLIRGTQRHEDHAGVGAAMTEPMIRKEMIMIKDMGANFIRLGHYQQSSIVLDLCDSLGLLVWEEIPWCRGGLGGRLYQGQAKRMLTNMINQHYNHPAVIIWGLGNENDWPGDYPDFDKEAIRNFMSELNDLAHQLDPTRKTAIRRCDFCKDIVDVYSPSIWAGWYRGKFTEYKQVTKQEMEKVDHFLHMEWGASSHARRHSEDPDIGLENIRIGEGADERLGDAALHGGNARVSRDGDWSETYACNLFDWTLKEQETMDWLTGTAFWVFKDFSTPGRPENPVPYVNQKGVVERDFTKKESFYVVQSYWAKKPMVHIYGHSWPVRWGKADDQRLLKVYSNCPEVELFLNGESLGKKHRNSQDYPAAGLSWRTALKPGENIVKATGYFGTEKIVDEISFEYQTKSWNEPYELKVKQVNYQNDTATVWVQLLDKNSTLCLDAKNVIEYALAGSGKLIDDLGTSTGSRKVQLFNGAGMIRVCLNHSTNWISVNSDAIKPAFARLSNIDSLFSFELKPVYFRMGDLEKVKEKIRNNDPDFLQAYHALLADADSALNHPLYAVTHKTSLPASEDIHDYFSVGPYWWPDSTKPDGLPYVRHDGKVNPERYSNATDAIALKAMRDDVINLALAYFFTDNERYAFKASEMLRTWFIDPTTRMNPNMDYAQAIPGRVNGRDIGIIDGAGFIEMLDFIRFIDPADCWSDSDRKGLKQWFADFLNWMQFSDNGRGEYEKLNNHGTWYDAQVAAYALFTGQKDFARHILVKSKEKRIVAQIKPDGSQPKELSRTKSLSYSTMNLRAFITLAQLGEQCGVDLWNYQASGGASIKKAVDFLVPFLDLDRNWPYQQIVAENRVVLIPLILQSSEQWHDEKYLDFLKQFPCSQFKDDRFILLYDPDSSGLM